MAGLRKTALIGILLVVLFTTVALAFPSSSSGEDKSIEESRDNEKRETSDKNKDKESTSGSNTVNSGDKKCASRHNLCRTFGPKPLPCCEGYVCKVTYGEQHCVDPWVEI